VEKRLIEAARGGHARATATILNQLQNRWFRYALARTGSTRRAVEVVQDSAIGLIADRAEMPNREKFDAWAMAFAVRSAAHPDGPTDLVKEARASGLPIPIAHLDDDDKAVLAKLQKLPPDALAALLLRIGEGLSRPDVAAITGLPPAEVTTLVKSAIESLRLVPVADWPVDPQAWYLRAVYPADLREEFFQKRKPKWIFQIAVILFFVSVVMLAVGNHFKPNRDVMPATTTAKSTAPT
jgi:DNA-directed RNA polymerase specialized sigma24 family protein